MSTTITTDQFKSWSQQQIDAACDWARANALDPNDIAACVDPVLVVTRTEIRYRRFVRNKAGRAQLRLDADEVWTEPRTAKRITPLPRLLTKPWHKVSSGESDLTTP